MAQIATYEFEGLALRIVQREGEPWFVTSDAAQMLGHRDAEKLARALDVDEKDTHRMGTPGGEQDVSIISEPGLYKAVLQRRATRAVAPQIKARIARFQRWVFHEVLPSIRRSGSYRIPTPDLITGESVSVRRQLVAECRQTFGVQAARELWLKLGLVTAPAMFAGSQQSLFDFTYTATKRAE